MDGAPPANRFHGALVYFCQASRINKHGQDVGRNRDFNGRLTGASLLMARVTNGASHAVKFSLPAIRFSLPPISLPSASHQVSLPSSTFCLPTLCGCG